jgi:hypothetical protein
MTVYGGALPVPNPNKSIAAARAKHVATIEGVYDIFGVGKEARGGYHQVAEVLGIPDASVGHVTAWMKRAGFLTIRSAGMPDGSFGKSSYWTLHKSKEECIAALKAGWGTPGVQRVEAPVMEAVGDEPEPQAAVDAEDAMLALASEKSNEETRAIAGPEPESPFAVLRSLRKDESGALIEAARQYANRAKLVDQKLGELEAAGIHVDRSAVTLPKDPVLDAVSLILPFINSLENTLHNFSEQNDALRRKMADYDQMKRSYETLKRRFEKDVAAKVAAATTYS